MRKIEFTLAAAATLAGPACAGILADWGADVVKLEPPGGGDPARTYQRLFGEEMPDNPVFEMDNRSKRSVAVDLRVPEGRSLALELLDGAAPSLSGKDAAAPQLAALR